MTNLRVEYAAILRLFRRKILFFAGYIRINFRRAARKVADPVEKTPFPSGRFGKMENYFLCRRGVAVVPEKKLPKTLPPGV
jgi:hypothetical protein